MVYMYCFTLLIVLLCVFLCVKFEKKVSFFLNLFVSLIIMMCYISSSSFIIDKLGFDLNYLCCSIFNFLTIILFIIYFVKKKNVQKMYFDKSKLIFYILLLAVTLFIMFYTFGFNFDVSFYSPDASAHFLSSRYFSLSQELNAEINLVNSQTYSNGFQFFFYTNLGTIYKCLPNLSVIGQYNIFVIYSFFVFYMLGASFFEILMLKVKTKKQVILAGIISILYAFGYPLNVTLYGFSYWNTGILLCQFIIFMLLFSKNINKKLINYLLGISLFSLFCSYYLFVPIMYFVVFLFFLRDGYKNGKINIKSFLIRCFIFLGIPFVLGFCYFVLPNLLIDSVGYVSGMGLEGDIFVDIISNYLFLIPIVIYAIIEKKNKTQDFLNNIFLYNLVYVVILFVFSLLNVLSIYYFSKILYLNWVLIWLLVYNGLTKLNKIVPDFAKIYSFIYVLMLSLTILGTNDKILEKKSNYEDVMVLDNLYSIYKWNIDYMRKPMIYFTKEYVNLINTYINLNKSINTNNETYFAGVYVQKRWFEALTDKFPFVDYSGTVMCYYLPTSYLLWEQDDEAKYMLVEKSYNFVDFSLKKAKEENDILMESNNLIILKKTNNT